MNNSTDSSSSTDSLFISKNQENNITNKEQKTEQHIHHNLSSIMEDEDITRLDSIKNILDVEESKHPVFVLAKNKARFKKKLIWYKSRKDWLDVAPLDKVTKLFKQQSKELDVIRSNKLDYEMELETCSLTPNQQSHRKDELKMCKVHEKMAIQLITKMQFKFKICR